MNIPKLEKKFQRGQTLTSIEMTAITDKIDEIINAISSINTEESGSNSGITESEIQAKVNEAKEEVTDLINSAIALMQQNIEDLQNAPEGASLIITAELWAQYRKKTDDLETDVSAIKLSYNGIDLVALLNKVDQINSWYGSISVDPGKIEILAALLDENNELVVKPASIIAAITKSSGRLKSSITVSADQVYLDGDVTVTDKITAMNADIATLNANYASIDTADILSAIINEIEAGNVNVTGTLHYNKLIGNVSTVSGTTLLSDNIYFVKVVGGGVADYPTITLPVNPEIGLTIFIYGDGYWALKANKPIRYYQAYWTSDTEHEIKEGYKDAQQSIEAKSAGWFGVGQFIYDGTQWQQLTQNISFRAGTRV